MVPNTSMTNASIGVAIDSESMVMLSPRATIGISSLAASNETMQILLTDTATFPRLVSNHQQAAVDVDRVGMSESNTGFGAGLVF